MPVGIENLATGFLQGLDKRRLLERQDVQDAREQERFDMQKSQFADQQAANAFNLKNNQTLADRQDITWKQEQDKYAKDEAFKRDLQTIFSFEKEGNVEGLAKFLTEKNKTLGIDGDFERDYVAGKGALKLDKDGKAVFVHKDGSKTTYDMDDYGADFIAKFDPITAITNKQKTKAEIAKEERDYKHEVAKLGIQHQNAVDLANINNRSANYRAGLKTDKPPKVEVLPQHLLKLFEEQYEVYGGAGQPSQIKTRLNQAALDDFSYWASENKLPATTQAYQLWRKSKAAPQIVTNPTGGATPTQDNPKPITPKQLNQYAKSRDWALSQPPITDKTQFKDVVVKLTKDGLSKDQIKQIMTEAGVEVQ